MSKVLKRLQVENYSGLNLDSHRTIDVIRKCSFKIRDVAIGGDAPKDVIQVYQYNGIIRKQSPKTWPVYIAKIGQKWYPNESITEQLITEIGKEIGVKIAESGLFFIEGVIRFCSKHFHSHEQLLSHGAEILSSFKEEPNDEWIEELERKNKIRESIDIEDIIKAIKAIFPNNYKAILNDFYEMLLFDCLVGNNDRHYYNWGVITHIMGQHEPYFSPIYDTARGLWWNSSDNFIVSLSQDKNKRQSRLKKYVNNSKPKISIPGNSKCHHFDLIHYLVNQNYLTNTQKEAWSNNTYLANIYEVVENKFCNIIIPERLFLIKESLSFRFSELSKVLNQ